MHRFRCALVGFSSPALVAFSWKCQLSPLWRRNWLPKNISLRQTVQVGLGGGFGRRSSSLNASLQNEALKQFERLCSHDGVLTCPKGRNAGNLKCTTALPVLINTVAESTRLEDFPRAKSREANSFRYSRELLAVSQVDSVDEVGTEECAV